MGRITTITKERILEAAFDMLVRDGYSNVNIKTLAAEIGCSTQPISGISEVSRDCEKNCTYMREVKFGVTIFSSGW